MPSRQVTSTEGKLLKRSECIYIGGKYYERGATVVQLEHELAEVKEGKRSKARWWRIEKNPWITYNSKTRTWFSARRYPNFYKRGIVGVTAGKAIKGYVRINKLINVLLLESYDPSYKNHSPILCDNKIIAEELGYIPSLIDNFYYKKASLTREELKKINTKYHPDIHGTLHDASVLGGNGVYSATDSHRFILMTKYYEQSQIIPSKEAKMVASLLNNAAGVPVMFGIEIEYGGHLTEKILHKYGVVPLRDGSVYLTPGGSENGFEGATVPYSGAKGVEALIGLCKNAAPRIYHNSTMGNHYHFSGMLTDGGERPIKEHLVALTKLIIANEDVLFNMVPACRKFPQGAKDYCMPLSKIPRLKRKFKGPQKNYEPFIDIQFDELLKWFGSRRDGEGGYTTIKPGPSCKWGWGRKAWYKSTSNGNSVMKTEKPWGPRKWEAYGRASMVNYANILFGEINTIEFRLWPASTNYIKNICHLLISFAFCRFAEANARAINEGTVFTIFDVVDGFVNNFGKSTRSTAFRSFVAEYLTAFIKSRTIQASVEYKKESKGKNITKPLYCKDEFKNDEKFIFTLNKDGQNLTIV